MSPTVPNIFLIDNNNSYAGREKPGRRVLRRLDDRVMYDPDH